MTLKIFVFKVKLLNFVQEFLSIYCFEKADVNAKLFITEILID
jgi:hypothetical protein